MGTIIRLKDANFTNSNLPKLGDYGKLITDDMHAMQQMLSQSNYLDDSTGSGNNLVYIGTGSTPVDPTFNNGILTLPDGWASKQTYHQYTAGVASGNSRTFVLLIKPNLVRTNYLWRYKNTGVGVSMVLNSAGKIQAVFKDKVMEISDALSTTRWNIVVFSASETTVKCSVNGSHPQTIIYANNGGAPVAPNGEQVVLGGTGTQGAIGDYAYSAIYNRALTESEMSSTFKAIKAWALTQKEIII
ncbi:LamG-like jellyroll fold domain-containing protein [Providencia sp. PROV046]|uniref:LamG-like jellyroll fold domain-containing protein n=4 Tax=Providencia TaxID=586 RepID=UPI002934D944|nr:LamG-like jellyroll fold domain-containing protein [Providencia sp. PROV046]WOC01230.1 hypothetical protein P3L55_07940 [Providencia sp. PROV046]